MMGGREGDGNYPEISLFIAGKWTRGTGEGSTDVVGGPIFNMQLMTGVVNGGPVEFHYLAESKRA